MLKTKERLAMTDIATIARARGLRTRHAVYEWFTENPCHTKTEAAKALGLTTATVGAHSKAIRDGWRPEAVESTAENGQ